MSQFQNIYPQKLSFSINLTTDSNFPLAASRRGAEAQQGK
jgi:hypothetical protein